MKMSGEELIPASRQRVWEALNDPEVLKQCIPGCEEIKKNSPTEFEARVVAKVGPVKAGFTGAVTLSELDPPNSYVITGEGKGGAAGFAKGGAKVNLEDADGGTRLRYDVDAQVGGKLAQIGSRLIDSTAKKMADQFFKNFAEVASKSEAGEEVVAPAPEAGPATKKARAPRKAAAPKTGAKTTRTRKSTRAAPVEEEPRVEANGHASAPPSMPPPPSPSTPPPTAATKSPPPRAASTPSAAGNWIWWAIAAAVVVAIVWAFNS